MRDLLSDLRFALRQMRRAPGFTAAAVTCLALGIGANSAAFSFARAVLSRRPPLREPERLMRVYVSWSNGLEYGSFSWPDYLDLRDGGGAVLEGLVAETLTPLHLAAGGDNERVWGSLVSMDYFTELAVPIALGRGFAPSDGDAPGAAPVAVLDHRTWVERFGADPAVVGREIELNGHPFTVLGVTAAAFTGASIGIRPEIYAPLLMQRELRPGADLFERRGSHWITFVIGRLRPGVSLDQARSGLRSVMARLASEHPESNRGKSVVVVPESEGALHPMVRQGFVDANLLVSLVVAAILLLACANVAGLLLARAAARRREIAIRLAIGGGRARIVRQLLVEAGLLAALGGAAGLAASVALARFLLSSVPEADFPFYLETRLDLTVVLFTAAVTLAAGLVFGLVPALQATRSDLTADLKEGAPGQTGARASRLRRALVVAQIALSFVLLVAAGFVLQSLLAVNEIDPGFVVERQLVASLDLALEGYDETRGRLFLRDLRHRLEARPGIEAVGFAAMLPLSFSDSQDGVVPEGQEDVPAERQPFVSNNVVDHGYLTAAGVRLVAGRGFAESDDEEAPPVLLVNQAFAERFWPGEDAVGKQVATGDSTRTVIGVVQNGKYFTLGEAQKPYFYRPLAQSWRGFVVLHVRTRADPERAVPVVRREVAALDASLPLGRLQTMESHLGFALAPARMMAGVVSAFALVALLLAAVGLYGVLAYWVEQATRELAVRMALGAGPSDVVAHVVAHGMGVSLLGIVLGAAGSIALARLLAGLVYGVEPTEPLAYLLSIGALGLAAFLATFLPAWRAARLDPVVGLRV